MLDQDTVYIELRARDGTVRAYAIIDAADAEWVNQWRWTLSTNGYVWRGTKINRVKRNFYLHRELLGLVPGDGVHVDHINRNRLDCRRRNLRGITTAGNRQNVPSKPGSSSSFRGVCWDRRTGRWQAGVKLDGVLHFLGRFNSEEEAAEAARAGRARLLPYAVD